MVIFAKIVARRFDGQDALLQETLSRVEFCRKHGRARGIADRLLCFGIAKKTIVFC